jgi:hypothetical protein
VNTSPIRSSFSRDPVSATYLDPVYGSREGARGATGTVGAAAAAIDTLMRGAGISRLVALVSLLPGCARAGVLPDDRFDVLYHHYNGGGMNIQSLDPGAQNRRSRVGGRQLLCGQRHGASIPYQVPPWTPERASTYHEGASEIAQPRRVAGKTTYSAGYIAGNENDYRARTASPPSARICLAT